jgi:RNA polymerase sigma-70 factor (ECF subfamily)
VSRPPAPSGSSDSRRPSTRSIDPIDREVLTLRHLDELTAEETARVLGLERSAASKRYMRALRRLKDSIGTSPDGGEGLMP